jgi:hypothetical protein
MAQFILLYKGPATPQADTTPEVGAELTQAWGAWMGKVGQALVDGGALRRQQHRTCGRWLNEERQRSRLHHRRGACHRRSQGFVRR